MTKLYASSSGATSSQNVACVPAQEEAVIESYDRLLREIRNQLDEFPVGETVLVGNCPADVTDEEIHGFFHGFATAVRLKRVCAKALTTTLYIAKFDSAESASRSKVLHTLSLKEKKILLLQLEDRQLFGKNHVVELNGFQDHPEEVIYDHMSAFGQVNFILKTKTAAYVVYDEPSSVEGSSRCEYLDQYPVTIRSVLNTSIGSVANASASGIDSCLLEQLDQLVEEDEGQINNFMQLLDMDNLDEYMEMNEREKSAVIDKPLLEVGNEEIIANEDFAEEDAANMADVAAIEKQALTKEPVGKGFVLVDYRSALWLKLDGNLLRLSDLPQLRVRVQKAVAVREKKYQSIPDKKHRSKDYGDSKSKQKSLVCGSKKSKKDKPKKEIGDGAKKETPEKSKTNEDSVKSVMHRETSPAKTSSKDKKKKEERSKSNDVAVNIEPKPEKLKSNEETPPKKPSKEQPKKDRSKSAHSVDVVVKIEPSQSVVGTSKVEAPKEMVTPPVKSVLEFVKQDLSKHRKPVVVLKRLTAKQLAELSIVRRESSTPATVVNKVEEDQPKERKHDKSSEEKRRREKEKRKRSKHSGDSSEAKRRKKVDGSSMKEAEKKKVEPADDPVVLDAVPEPVFKEDVVPAECTPMEVEVPFVVEESASAKEVIAKLPELPSTLLSDDEEQRLVIDLPQEAKPEVEKPVEMVVQAEPVKPPQENRLVVKLDTRSAAILYDKVHESFLLHLDVLSRVLIKLDKISSAGYELPKPPAKVTKPSRKSPVEVPTKKREEKPPPDKVRKTDLDKIDNKFLPAGSKLKSQAKAKSKHDSSHKKQHHHHVPVPELPAELKKSHLNTSFKIPKKNSHSSKPAAHSASKHGRSELECLHREDEERERQRKRFQKEPKRPENRPRTKKPTVPQVEQQRSNTPDFFDPMWDDDGGGGGNTSPIPEQNDPPPREQENTVDSGWNSKKPFVPGGNEREMDKKGPSFRDIWNLPPEKPKVWEKEPWANNAGTIDSGEMWSAEERAHQAVPVLPLFVQEPINHQRNNSAIDAGESWSPGGAPRSRPNSSTERRNPRASDNAMATTIGDGESWSPEADTSKRITALNLDDRRRPPPRQDDKPQKHPPPQPPRRQESPAPRRGIDTISSGDMWDSEPAGFERKPLPSGPIWESDVKPDRSKENLVPDYLSDSVIRGASNDRSEKSWSNDRFRGGRRSPGMDDRGRRRSRDRSPDLKRRRNSCWSPTRKGHSPDRRPWDRDPSPGQRASLDQPNRDRDVRFDRSLDRDSLNRNPGRQPSLDHRSRDESFNRSPGRRPSLDHRSRDETFSRSPVRRLSLERIRERDGRFDRSLDRSPARRDSLERRHWPRGISPRRGLSPVRRNSPIQRRRSRTRSPEGKPIRAWSPFGSGVGGAGKRRSKSRSPVRRFFGRVSRSPEERPRLSPVRRGAARFRSRSRSRDRHDEDQYRKRSRSPPVARNQRQHPREASRERSREGSWGRSGRGGRDDAFNVDRNAFSSTSRDLWDAPVEEERLRPASTDRRKTPARLDDDEIPYSPSNFLDEEEDSRVLLETIPLKLPPIAKSSPTKQPEVVLRPQSVTEDLLTSKETQIRVKQEQILMSQESTTMVEESVAGTAVEKPCNVKLERCPTTEFAEQRQPSSAYVTDPEPPTPQEEIAPEPLNALGHLKQRAERLKKLEEMKLARQKLMAQMKMHKETEKVSQVEEQEQVQQQPQIQPEPVVRNMLKVEPPSERVSTPIVANIKQEQQSSQQEVDPSAASLLLETAVSILSNFGHLLPSLTAGSNPVAAALPPSLPTTPSLPPPLPAEALKPPPPHEPPPQELPPVAYPSAAVVPPPIWESPGFPQMPDLGQPPPSIMQPAVPFETVEQQQFQHFPMGPGDMNSGPGSYQENNYDDWKSQGPNFDTGVSYEDQPQGFNYDDESNWNRRQAQEFQPLNDGPDSWQQPTFFNSQQQNQQQDETFQLLPPEELRAQRKGPSHQFDGGFGGNQRNRDPRQRFRGNNRGHNNNNSNAFRDPRRNRGGSIYAGGSGGFPQQQQQQQQQGQQWNRNNNNNFNRGGRGGQFGNQQRNRNNSWKQGNQRRGGGFFQQRSQQQQQQQHMGDEFLIDSGGDDGSNWNDFMQ